MAGIFINFRSKDAGSYAAVYLDKVLTDVFGENSVFRSSRSIPAGAMFDRHLVNGVLRSDIVLVLVGPEWLGTGDGSALPQLHREDDWVRREIAIAITECITIIPVLLTGASRPSRDDLPDDIAALADRQAVYLRHRHIDQDMAHLFAEIMRISPGLATTHLFTRRAELPDSYLPSVLLRPEYGVVPFSGRDAEIRYLKEWAEESDAISVRLITAPGGQGKTRLAQHLCESMTSDGWLAGIVRENADPMVLLRLRELGVPLLLVIDYAETHTKMLVRLVAAIMRVPADGAPVRLLLLARSAGEWIRDLHDQPDDQVAELFMLAREHQLTSLVPRAPDRHAEFARAHGALAHRLKRSGDSMIPPPDLEHDKYDRALDIHALALACLLDEMDPSAESDPWRDPIARVLHHERRYWRRTVSVFGLTDPHAGSLDAAVAAATLFGARTPSEATTLLRGLAALRNESETAIGRYVRWLGHLYPGADALNPMRPDRLGETHIALALKDDPGIIRCVSTAISDVQLARALTVLGRAAPRNDHLRGALKELANMAPSLFITWGMRIATGLEDPRPLTETLAAALNENPHEEAVRTVLDLLPASSLALAELAVAANDLALRAHLEVPNRDPAVTAYLLDQLARRLREMGRRDDALVAITEAVNLHHELAKARPDAFMPNLAASLNIRSICLAEVGGDEEACDVAEMTVGLYRKLQDASPQGTQTFASETSNALNTLSNRYRAIGQHGKALDAASAAISVMRQAADSNDDALRAGLARTLNSLAIHLSAADRAEEALMAMSECVEIRRRLAEDQPDAFLPDLASALNNRALCFSAMGNHEMAAASAAECVEIYRALAEHRPDRFLSDLAMSLNNLAIDLRVTGKHENALVATEESVQIYTALAHDRPAIFLPDLAMALNNYSTRLATSNQFQRALEASNNAVAIRRGLAVKSPELYLPALGAALNNNSIRLREAGYGDLALDRAKEMVKIYRDVTAGNNMYQKEIAMAIHSLAKALHSTGHIVEGLSAVAESIDLLRRLMEFRPETTGSDLAKALITRGRLLAGDEVADATAALIEAYRLCRGSKDIDLIEEINSDLSVLYERQPGLVTARSAALGCSFPFVSDPI